MNRILGALAMATALSTATVIAQTTFQAALTGAAENNPLDTSTATGIGTVVLSLDQTHITVDESWTGLLGNATASHIHGPAAPGSNAGVLFPFTGVPAATSGAIPEQIFSITPAQVLDLENGLYYFNVHSTVFGGGEIRGQILPVPEPSIIALASLGLVATGCRFRLRRDTDRTAG